MKKIKIGIVGCGRLAQHYKTVFESGVVQNFEIIAVCDKNIDTTIDYAKLYNCKAFDNLPEMIKYNKPDLVIILTPSGEHFNDTKSSLTMGCHTLVEKPITMLPNQAEELDKISIASKLMYGVVFQNRLNPPIQLLEKELKSKNFGRIITSSIRLRWCRMQEYYEDDWHGTWKRDGGVINQQAIHHIDVMNWLLGPITEVCATGGNLSNNLEAEDTMVAIIKFENGSLGTIEATTALRPKDFEASISVIGDKGIATIGGIALNKIENWILQDYKDSEESIIDKYSQEVPNGYGLSHGPFVQDVIDNLLEGKIKPPVSAKDGILTSKIIHSLYASYEQKSWIRIKDNIKSQKLGL